VGQCSGTPDLVSRERLCHGDRERPADVEDGDEPTEHYENLRRQARCASNRTRSPRVLAWTLDCASVPE
jgi:hypothetical protein